MAQEEERAQTNEMEVSVTSNRLIWAVYLLYDDNHPI